MFNAIHLITHNRLTTQQSSRRKLLTSLQHTLLCYTVRTSKSLASNSQGNDTLFLLFDTLGLVCVPVSYATVHQSKLRSPKEKCSIAVVLARLEFGINLFNFEKNSLRIL